MTNLKFILFKIRFYIIHDLKRNYLLFIALLVIMLLVIDGTFYRTEMVLVQVKDKGVTHTEIGSGFYYTAELIDGSNVTVVGFKSGNKRSEIVQKRISYIVGRVSYHFILNQNYNEKK